MICDCDECTILTDLDRVTDTLINGKPMVYFAFFDDDSKELAYQRGLQAGYRFRYNELMGFRLFE